MNSSSWLDPGFRPGEHAARSGPAAAFLREYSARRHLTVHRKLGAARGKEGAVHAERPVHRAWRHGENEGRHEVPPAEDDLVLARHDALFHGAERIAAALELRIHDRQRAVGERLMKQQLDRALEKARDGGVVGIDLLLV